METANRRMAAQAMSTLPRYAGGGLIDSLKRAVGLKEDTPEQKAYKERSAAERSAPKAPKPAAAAMAEPPKAITSYLGGTATTDRMKAVDAMATGGPVTGPGTGTSDEVPILASNGEYMIRAAAVEEIGTEVLDAINKLGDDNETDEPMEKAADPDAAMGKESLPKYATGGPINKFGTEVPNSEDQQRQLAAQTSNYVAGAQANAAARPAVQAMAANPPAPVAQQAVSTLPTPAAPSTRPMDATAVADRKTASSVFDAAKDVSETAGRAIADVATIIPRGIAGAYDSTVVRPMRAMGMNAAYLSPALTPNGASVDSATPFTDIKRARDQQALAAGSPQPATPTPVAPVVAANAVPPQANPSAPNPASGSPDQVMPEGKVNVSVQPNGVKSFSGQNISGQPQYTGSAANTMNSGVITPQNQLAMDGMQARQDARDQGMRNKLQYDQEVANAQAVNDAGRRMNLEYEAKNGKPQEAKAAAQLLAQLDATSMKTAELQSADKRFASQQQIEKDRNAQQSQGTALDNQAKQQMLAAQTELANAKTPEQEAAAEKKLRALQGKYGKDLPEQYAYAPGGQSIDPVTGQAVTQPGVIFNKSTGEVKQPGQSKSIEADPRAIAIRDNKNLTREQKLAELKKIGYQ